MKHISSLLVCLLVSYLPVQVNAQNLRNDDHSFPSEEAEMSLKEKRDEPSYIINKSDTPNIGFQLVILTGIVVLTTVAATSFSGCIFPYCTFIHAEKTSIDQENPFSGPPTQYTEISPTPVYPINQNPPFYGAPFNAQNH